MKAPLIFLVTFCVLTSGAFARGGHGGSHSSSHSSYGSGYSSSSYSSGSHSSGSPGSHSVSGYTRKDGTYVAPHHATNSDSTTGNNWSHVGNVNPYTGQVGTKRD